MERLVDPLTTTDAKLWADEFMKVKARLGEQKFDHAMMLGWFAHALMQGYDEGQRRAKGDSHATVEALQAVIRQMGEQAAVLAKDGMAAKAQVEALQRELLEWKRALCNLTPGGSEFADDHAYCAEWVRKARENQHDIIISKHRKLKATQTALDAERELSAAWAEKARQYELELDGDPQNFHGQGRTIGVREQLSQLQALVRAFVDHFDGDFENPGLELYGQVNGQEIANGGKALNDLLDKARATLDAMTPAGQRASGGRGRGVLHTGGMSDGCSWISPCPRS